jgi:hypothetical protein
MPSESVLEEGKRWSVEGNKKRCRRTEENCTTRWDEMGGLLHEITRIKETRRIEKGGGERMLELRRTGGNVGEAGGGGGGWQEGTH